MSSHIPTPEQIADAIEILSMCTPINDLQGGMWFGRNHDFADATFVDYGACRAFAVAARALPILVKRDAALVKALRAIAGWRTVNLSAEYEHGLRDVIRSVVDCAVTALETTKVPS